MSGIQNQSFGCSREDLVDAVGELAGDAREVTAFAFAAHHEQQGGVFAALSQDLEAVLAFIKTAESTPAPRPRVRFGFKAHHRPRAGGWR